MPDKFLQPMGKQKRLLRVTALAALLALLGAGLGLLALRGLGPACPIYRATGLYCPTCGAGRAAGSLLGLDFSAALAYNAPLVLALPLLALGFVRQARRYVRGEKIAFHLAERITAIVLVGVFLLFGLLRNLPAFSFFAPG